MAGITAHISGMVDRIQRAGKKILVNSSGHAVITDLGAGVVHADSSGVLTSSPITNGDVDASVPRPNVIVNGGFEIWQRGTAFAGMADAAFACDRWQFSKSGTSTLNVDQETTIVDPASRYSAKLTFTKNVNSSFYQKLDDAYQLRGLTLTVSMQVRSNTASAVRLRIDDSAGAGTAGSYHTGGSTFETLTATKVIDSAATSVTVLVLLEATSTNYLDNAMLVAGTVAATYVPLRPAEDLLRCQRYYEVIGSGTAGESFGIGQASGAGAAYVHFRYVEKAVAPTITVSAAADFAAVTATGAAANAFSTITPSGVGRHQAFLSCSGASGLVAGNATLIQAANTSARIKIEANP